MKSVLLNNAGYTADGQWRLVVVDPKPEMSAKGLCISEAEHDPAGVYRAMIAASPAPELGEAVPADWRSIINEFIGEAEQTYCPDSTCKYPDARCCREDMKNLVQQAKALLQSPSAINNRIAELEVENQELRADAERYRWWGSNMFRNAAMVAKTLASVSCGAELDAAIDAAKGADRG